MSPNGPLTSLKHPSDGLVVPTAADHPMTRGVIESPGVPRYRRLSSRPLLGGLHLMVTYRPPLKNSGQPSIGHAWGFGEAVVGERRWKYVKMENMKRWKYKNTFQIIHKLFQNDV